MKKLAWLLFALGSAQVFGQSVDQYSFGSFATGVYQPLVGASPLLSGQTQLSAAVPMGFDFFFEGNIYSSFRVSTDGYVVLGSATIPQGITNDLSTPFAAPIVAPLWDALLFTQAGAQISYQTSGPAFNRILTVQFASGQFNNPGFPGTGEGDINLQVRFYEADGVIEFVYGFVLPTSSFQPSASIGLNGESNTFLSVAQDFQNVSNAVSYNALDAFPAVGTVFRFAPPDGDFIPPVLSNFALNPSATQCQPVARTATLHATDDLSGVQEVWFVRFYNGVEQPPVAFSLSSGNANDGIWTASVPAAPSGQTVAYYVNAFDGFGNAVLQMFSGSFVDFQPTLTLGPDPTINSGSTAVLTADAPEVLPIRITEVILDPTGAGGAALPPYVPPTAKNLVEIANLGNVAVPTAGIRLVVQGEGARAFDLPELSLAPGQTLLVRIGSGTDSPANRFFHTGGTNDPLYIESYVGFYLVKNTTVLDAVGLTYYDFEAPVTSAHWSGSLFSSGAAGFVRRFADSNGASDWTPSDPGTPVTPNGPNPGLNSLPNVSIVWTPGNLNGFVVSTPPLFSTTVYTATLTFGACTVSQTLSVNVVSPQSPNCDFTVVGGQYHTTQSVVCFQDLTTGGIPDFWQWTFTPPTVEYVSGQNTANPCVRFLSEGTYTVSLTVSNSVGTDTETKTEYVFIFLDYCAPQYAFAGTADYIARVRLGTMDNSSADEPEGYSLYPFYNPNLARGQSYDLTITNGPTANEYVGAWIDFNRNGVFDANEHLGELHLTAAGQTQTLSFVVPNNAALGQSRLRVRMAYQESGVTPCGLHQYGETEDYYVVVVASGCETPPVGGTAAGPANAPAFSAQNYSLSGYTGTIQWQYSLDGENWFNVPGGNAPLLSIQLNYDNQVVRFRAMLTSPGCDPAYSNVVSTQVLPLQGNSAGFPFDITDFPYADVRNSGNFTATLAGQTAPDVFYRFSAPNCLETLNISTCGSSFDVRLFVLDATLNVVAQAENNCSSLGANLQVAGLVWGQMYFIVVSGVDGQYGDYILNVFAQFGPGGLVVNGGPDASIFCGGTTLLTATVAGGSGDYLVQWDAGWIPGPSLEVSAAGVYVVRAYDVGGAGCMATDTVVVSLQGSAFSLTVQPAQALLCEGQSQTLTATITGATGATVCTWNNGDTGSQIVVDAAGIYSCTCVDEAGCAAIATANIEFAPLPGVDLGPNFEACVGADVTLDAGNPGSAYIWSNGATTRTVTLTLDQIGTSVVGVTVINAFGCFAIDEVEIEVGLSPETQLPSSLALCAGQTVTLIPGIVGAQYLWSDGSTQPFFPYTAQTPGTETIRVEISTDAGCYIEDSVVISVLLSPQPDLGPDRSVCSGETTVLNAGIPEAEYLWSTGATTQSVAVTEGGLYWVEVLFGECAARDTILLVAPPPPNVTTILPDTVIVNQAFTAQAVGSAQSFSWTFGISAAPQAGTGQTVANVRYSTPGPKLVTLVVGKDGCDFVFRDTLFVKDTVTSRTLAREFSYSVYPNPAKESLTLRLPHAGVNAEIYDATGKLVLRKTLLDSTTVFTVDSWAEGVYLLRLLQGNRELGRQKFHIVR